MQEMHQDIDKNDNLQQSRLIRCLKICIDSLLWIQENSVFNLANKIRARDTIKEIKKILDK